MNFLQERRAEGFSQHASPFTDFACHSHSQKLSAVVNKIYYIIFLNSERKRKSGIAAVNNRVR